MIAYKYLIIGSDHAGVPLKVFLKDRLSHLREYILEDIGCDTKESVDYPDFITPVVSRILKNPASTVGVLLCGTGIGMSIGANRFHGIRAALCSDPTQIKLAREHNNANILCMGARLISYETAYECLLTFLKTPYLKEPRHETRLQKLESLGLKSFTL